MGAYGVCMYGLSRRSLLMRMFTRLKAIFGSKRKRNKNTDVKTKTTSIVSTFSKVWPVSTLVHTVSTRLFLITLRELQYC